MTRDWLWQLFHYEGKVVDVFVYWKKRRGGSPPFVFVRFAFLADAQKAIQNMNGLEVKGKKLIVSMVDHKLSETIPRATARTSGGRVPLYGNRITRNVVLQRCSCKEILIYNGT